VLMGVVELKTGLSSFIVTLAFLSAYGGGALLVSRGENFQITTPALNSLGSGTFLSAAVCPLAVVAVICGGITWVITTGPASDGNPSPSARTSGPPAPRA
jgi:ribose/xylose/arabinose/galactoside ABC-type transport system permease subunit